MVADLRPPSPTWSSNRPSRRHFWMSSSWRAEEGVDVAGRHGLAHLEGRGPPRRRAPPPPRARACSAPGATTWTTSCRGRCSAARFETALRRVAGDRAPPPPSLGAAVAWPSCSESNAALKARGLPRWGLLASGPAWAPRTSPTSCSGAGSGVARPTTSVLARRPRVVDATPDTRRQRVGRAGRTGSPREWWWAPDACRLCFGAGETKILKNPHSQLKKSSHRQKQPTSARKPHAKHHQRAQSTTQ